MRRFVLLKVAVVGLLLVLVGTASAAAPARQTFGAGGSVTNPCTEATVSYGVTGKGLTTFSAGLTTVKLHGTGTGTDGLGSTYSVTWDLTSVDDGEGTGQSHLVIVFVGGRTTFVFHKILHSPDGPDREFVTCAGMGDITP